DGVSPLLVLLSWLFPPHPTSRAYVVAAITRRPPRSASGRAFPGVAKRVGSITPQDSTGLWPLQPSRLEARDVTHDARSRNTSPQKRRTGGCGRCLVCPPPPAVFFRENGE